MLVERLGNQTPVEAAEQMKRGVGIVAPYSADFPAILHAVQAHGLDMWTVAVPAFSGALLTAASDQYQQPKGG